MDVATQQDASLKRKRPGRYSRLEKLFVLMCCDLLDRLAKGDALIEIFGNGVTRVGGMPAIADYEPPSEHHEMSQRRPARKAIRLIITVAVVLVLAIAYLALRNS